MNDKPTGETDILRPPGMEERVSFRIMRHGFGLNAEGQQWWQVPGTFETPEQVLKAIKDHLELMQQYPELEVTEEEYCVLKHTTTVDLWSEADE